MKAPTAAREPAGRAIDRAPAPGEAQRPHAVAHLWRALEEVNDPELPISLVDLGLIYDIRHALAEGAVVVEMTFTAMGCPCTTFIRQDITERLLAEDGVRSVEIVEVWSPPWRRERMTQRGRVQMRDFGVSVQ